ncbi:hypothetical protein SNEBB_004524 [Seison nebaliae]|nr:hypothetical protein SNEBB_004524 [Seison nebaliae]
MSIGKITDNIKLKTIHSSAYQQHSYLLILCIRQQSIAKSPSVDHLVDNEKKRSTHPIFVDVFVPIDLIYSSKSLRITLNKHLYSSKEQLKYFHQQRKIIPFYIFDTNKIDNSRKQNYNVEYEKILLIRTWNFQSLRILMKNDDDFDRFGFISNNRQVHNTDEQVSLGFLKRLVNETVGNLSELFGFMEKIIQLDFNKQTDKSYKNTIDFTNINNVINEIFPLNNEKEAVKNLRTRILMFEIKNISSIPINFQEINTTKNLLKNILTIFQLVKENGVQYLELVHALLIYSAYWLELKWEIFDYNSSFLSFLLINLFDNFETFLYRLSTDGNEDVTKCFEANHVDVEEKTALPSLMVKNDFPLPSFYFNEIHPLRSRYISKEDYVENVGTEKSQIEMINEYFSRSNNKQNY